jgi:hypothetical protein
MSNALTYYPPTVELTYSHLLPTEAALHLIMFIKRMLAAVLVAATLINALAIHNPKYKGMKA